MKDSFKRVYGILALILFVFSGNIYGKDKPNILWITSEDNGIKWLSCYGSKNAKTPNLDKLASEGFRYLNCYDNAAVCAPTRSTWITGLHAISMGTQPMRSNYAIPKEIKGYSYFMKEAGYHCTKPGKTDYNIKFDKDQLGWSNGKGKAPWASRKPGQPFFSVINFTSSHESRAHVKAGGKKSKESGKTNGTYIAKPENMELFSYHPDLPEIRSSYAQYANAVGNMDREVGALIQSVKDQGLYEDTIIVYNSDHGGVMPRSKRFCYSSGIHCPLIVRIPEKWKHFWPAEKPGMTVERLVSFVDMPKTWVSLAGGDVSQFQGKVFLGDGIESEAPYHLSFRERADERLDNVRMCRDKQFAYYKNYMPFAPAGQHLAYMWKIAAAPAWEKHHLEGKTNEITGRFFRPRVSEEFYDTIADFDNVYNLIADNKHQKKISELRSAMRKIQLEIYDSGLLPEGLRSRRAAANNMTIYEMVRNKELYPLEKYLDSADLALTRDKAHLNSFIEWLSDKDEGMRYWGIVGLLLLEDEAKPALESVNKALSDSCPEVFLMAPWVLMNIGEVEKGVAFYKDQLKKKGNNTALLCNILAWMGKPAHGIIKDYVAKNPQAPVHKKGPGSSIGIIHHVAKVNNLY